LVRSTGYREDHHSVHRVRPWRLGAEPHDIIEVLRRQLALSMATLAT